jgi:hypothetical protein
MPGVAVQIDGELGPGAYIQLLAHVYGRLEIDGGTAAQSWIHIGVPDTPGHVYGQVVIGNGPSAIGLNGSLAVQDSVFGSITVNGGMSGSGAITVGANVPGTISVTGDIAARIFPRMHIAGNVSGAVQVACPDLGMGGDMEIDGNIEAGGLLEIAGLLASTGHVQTGPVLGTLRINGEVAAGENPAQPSILISGDVIGDPADPNNGRVLIVGADNGDLEITGSVAAYGLVQIGGGLQAVLEMGGISDGGLVRVNGGIESAGNVHVVTNVVGALEVNGNVSADATPFAPRISIGGYVGGAGAVRILPVYETDGLYGSLVVAEAVGGYGLVHVAGNLGATGLVTMGVLSGAVEIDGTAAGTIEVLQDIGRGEGRAGPAISVGQSLTGEIRVLGSLHDILGVAHEAEIGGQVLGAFVVDWDADWVDQDTDTWDPNAVVWVAHADPQDPGSPPAEFHGNDSSAHCYNVTPCLGDMDNSGDVNFPDINPFIAALSDPAQYAALFPGLSESMVYHGDATCDTPPHLGFEDINPFIALVGRPCTACGAGGDAPMGGDGMNIMYEGGGLPSELPPEELAAQLAANVWPELYDGLLAMVLGAIEYAPDEATEAYWQAVYGVLTQ